MGDTEEVFKPNELRKGNLYVG